MVYAVLKNVPSNKTTIFKIFKSTLLKFTKTEKEMSNYSCEFIIFLDRRNVKKQ